MGNKGKIRWGYHWNSKEDQIPRDITVSSYYRSLVEYSSGSLVVFNKGLRCVEMATSYYIGLLNWELSSYTFNVIHHGLNLRTFDNSCFNLRSILFGESPENGNQVSSSSLTQFILIVSTLLTTSLSGTFFPQGERPTQFFSIPQFQRPTSLKFTAL